MFFVQSVSYSKESVDHPQGLILCCSVDGRDMAISGWPHKCPTNNLLVYAVWMQMIRLRSHTFLVCVTKGVLHAAMLLGSDSRFIISPFEGCLIPPPSPRYEASVWGLCSLLYCVSLKILIR